MGVPCFLIERAGPRKTTARIECGTCETAVDLDVPDGIEWDDIDWPPLPCGHNSAEDQDHRSSTTRHLWRRVDNGDERWSIMDFGPGAMWDADWMGDWMCGPDGRHMMVRLPNGRDWAIDSQASNCTRPGEDHDCWCRHGEPPNLTVDKVPEPGRSTCQAGAGSIQGGDWHGFLRNGQLVEA